MDGAGTQRCLLYGGPSKPPSLGVTCAIEPLKTTFKKTSSPHRWIRVRDCPKKLEPPAVVGSGDRISFVKKYVKGSRNDRGQRNPDNEGHSVKYEGHLD